MDARAALPELQAVPTSKTHDPRAKGLPTACRSGFLLSVHSGGRVASMSVSRVVVLAWLALAVACGERLSAGEGEGSGGAAGENSSSGGRRTRGHGDGGSGETAAGGGSSSGGSTSSGASANQGSGNGSMAALDFCEAYGDALCQQPSRPRACRTSLTRSTFDQFKASAKLHAKRLKNPAVQVTTSPTSGPEFGEMSPTVFVESPMI